MVAGDQRNLKSNTGEDGVMQYKITKVVWRENQFEIIYEVLDNSGKLVMGGLRTPVGPKELDKEAMDELFVKRILPEIEASQNQVAVGAEQTYTKSEVENLMISKGYLQPTEKIEDLKPLAELTAVTVEEIKK